MKPSIYLSGDVALHGLFDMDREGNPARFEEIAGLFNDSDLHIANLEAIASGHSQDEYSGKVHLSTSTEVLAEVIKYLSLKIVNLANNHALDGGVEGLINTIGLLDKLGVRHTGAGFKKEHLEPILFSFGNLTIAFAGYVHPGTNPRDEDPKLFMNYYDPGRIIDQIQTLKHNADRIILSLHWGLDYSNFFTARQQYDARRFIDSGADIIMGHHPHVVQSIERYSHGIIFYSLGQICFGDFIWEGKLRALKRKTKTGILVKFSDSLKIRSVIRTRELAGNRIKILRRKELPEKNSSLYRLNLLRNRMKLIYYILLIKESLIDRVTEYLFGYYRNPLVQFLSTPFKIRKVRYLRHDLNESSQ